MSVLLDFVRDELQKITLKEASADLLCSRKQSEHVLGSLKDPDVRRLFRLRNRLLTEAHQAGICAQQEMQGMLQMSGHFMSPQDIPAGFETRLDELNAIVSFANAKAKAIDELFWAALKAELPHEALVRGIGYNGGSIGLRKNWKIVAPPNSDPPPVLQMLFGGMM